MRISNQQLFENSVNQMTQQHSKVADLQSRIAEGKQLLNPSDNAEKTALIQRLNSAYGRQEVYESALDSVSSRLDLEESTVISSVNILQRIQELAILSNDGSTAELDTSAITTELATLRDALLAQANQQDINGNYIFSGTDVQSAAFAATVGTSTESKVTLADAQVAAFSGTITLNDGATTVTLTQADIRNRGSTTAGLASLINTIATNSGLDVTATDTGSEIVLTNNNVGVQPAVMKTSNAGFSIVTTPGTHTTAYTGNQQRMAVDISENRYIELNRPGDAIFSVVERGGVDVGFFQIIDDFIGALNGNNATEIKRALSEVNVLNDNMANVIVDIGTRQRMADLQQNTIADTKLRYELMLNAETELDYTLAITELTAEMLSLEAAQASFAKISQLSLFDYIR
tara:strand:+ start:325 stop:1533 length:1209 start_codon:yes stop_codon:yes gene_type:complete